MSSSPATSAVTLRTALTSPGRGLFGGTLDPGSGGTYEPVRGKGIGGLQRVEQDRGEGAWEPAGQLGPDLTHQMRAQQRQDGVCCPFGFPAGAVLAAFLYLVEERFPLHGHHCPFVLVLVRSAEDGTGG